MLKTSSLGQWIRSLMPSVAADKISDGKYVHSLLMSFFPSLPDHLQTATRFSGHLSRRWASCVGLLFGHFTSSFGDVIDVGLVESRLLRSIQSLEDRREARMSFVDSFCEFILLLVHLYNRKTPSAGSSSGSTFYHHIPTALAATPHRLLRLYAISPKSLYSTPSVDTFSRQSVKHPVTTDSVTASSTSASGAPTAHNAAPSSSVPSSVASESSSSSSVAAPSSSSSSSSLLSRLLSKERQVVAALRVQVEELQLRLEEMQQSRLGTMGDLLSDQRTHFSDERTARDRLLRGLQVSSMDGLFLGGGGGGQQQRQKQQQQQRQKDQQQQQQKQMLQMEKLKERVNELETSLVMEKESHSNASRSSLHRLLRIVRSARTTRQQQQEAATMGRRRSRPAGEETESEEAEESDEIGLIGTMMTPHHHIDEDVVVDALRDYVMHVRQEGTRLRAEVRQAENEKEGLRRKLIRTEDQLANAERQVAEVTAESGSLAETLRNAMVTIQKTGQESAEKERRHLREVARLREKLEVQQQQQQQQASQQQQQQQHQSRSAPVQGDELRKMIVASQKPVLDALRSVRAQKLRSLGSGVSSARQSLSTLRQEAFALRQAFREDHCNLTEHIRLLTDQWSALKRVSEGSTTRLNEHVYARQIAEQDLQVEAEKVRHLESQALLLQEENTRLKRLVRKYVRKTSKTLQGDNERLQKELEERVEELLKDDPEGTGLVDFQEVQELLQMVSDQSAAAATTTTPTTTSSPTAKESEAAASTATGTSPRRRRGRGRRGDDPLISGVMSFDDADDGELGGSGGATAAADDLFGTSGGGSGGGVGVGGHGRIFDDDDDDDEDIFGGRIDSPAMLEDQHTLQEYMREVGNLDRLKPSSPPRRPLL